MANNVQEETIKYIESIKELAPEERNIFIEKIKKGENPVEVMDEIEDSLQLKLDGAFKEAGVEIDENDPEYQTAINTMDDEMQATEDEFTKEMEDIEAETHKVYEDAVKDIDDLKIQSLQSKIAEK